jgi:serine/threonine-protein kinase
MLRACPTCQRIFPEDAKFCAADATELKSAVEVTPPGDARDGLVGHTLADRYELRRVVADGGMGRVYEAYERAADRQVAVKVLHAQVAEDTVNIERFRREAQTSKELRQKYIIDVIDFASVPNAPGRSKRTWYLAMEYLDGEELRSLLDREKTLPLPLMIRLTSQIAMALDPAHASGFVHRDMKPDNVYLVRDGEDVSVRLLDFGSVKFTKGQDRGNKLTVLGTTIGSPSYMSPEQAQGNPDIDHRTDTWAVNVIVYESLVGRVPYKGNNGPQILFKILSDEPEPPTFVDGTLPAALDDVLLRGFKRTPDERYQSVGALADALGHAFQLKGNHEDWASTPTSELAKQLPRSKPPPSLDTLRAASTPPPVPQAPLPSSATPRAKSSLRDTIDTKDDTAGSADEVLPPKPRVPIAAVVAVVLVLLVVAFFAMR